MIVTGIRADARTPGYLLVEIDGGRFASLPQESVHQLELAVGRDLTPQQSDRLMRLADVEAAFRVAVRLLTVRPRSVQEMLRRLKDRGHNPSAVAEAVGRLEAQGVLDDSTFARHFVRIRVARTHGASRLLRDLLARGVERRVAERAVDETLVEEAVDPETQARALAERRAVQLSGVPAAKRFRRIAAYLARRGFTGAAVRDMVRQVVGR